MRALLTIAVSALALAAAPAAAQVYDRAPEADVADALNSPLVQESVAQAMSGAIATILDVRIGGLERAIDPTSRARRSDTLRDRVDPDLEDDLTDETRRATRAMGRMADEFAILMPELRAGVADMSRRLDRVRDRYDDRAAEDWDD